MCFLYVAQPSQISHYNSVQQKGARTTYCVGYFLIFFSNLRLSRRMPTYGAGLGHALRRVSLSQANNGTKQTKNRSISVHHSVK